ncbi:TIGR02206 family membrane protein [Salipaludibacillus aurantiacus]|uniref:Conserved hypothetical integral membrane protein TIGR02206 n=1 Tax=Salipaludibacillus aurantiacus TaxID=1601833 RepID=A0A1H9UYN5_9BACI|nr:TIGR02206 family membrane protein [Salipaludibacillus aurantiacus]SES14650.1 conserved hypothetical integral membrane protein TIGR02206 [Salipaludibacillus aurantiacus]
MWFSGDAAEAPFTMFSLQHGIMIVILFVITAALYAAGRSKLFASYRKTEIALGLSLVLFELGYHGWLISIGNWNVSHALPLELSNISVLLVIVLLLTGNRHLFELVFMAGIGGALQALVTPVLDYGWPHFRFWHFFYTHMMVIWAAFYFLWMKKYSLTFKSVWKSLIFLNVLLPVIYAVNLATGGNYWFIMRKPSGASLLDFLGPHPWYLLGMEAAALIFFTVLWLLFGEKKRIAF